MKIHVNATSKDDVTQEFHFKLMEFKIFQFGVKEISPKPYLHGIHGPPFSMRK
jgi:hypothetical protein